MTKTFNLLALLIMLSMTQCTWASKSSKPEDPNNQVIYLVEKEGVFLYDLNTKKTKKIYATDQYFLKKKMEFLPDNYLVIGHQRAPYTKEECISGNIGEEKPTAGHSADPTIPFTDATVFVTDTFYAVHMDNGEYYKYKTIDYEYIQQKEILKSKTILFDRSGNIMNEKDTIQDKIRMYKSHEVIVFNPPITGLMRGESKSNIVNGIQIFSDKGSLYLKNENDTVLFLPFDRPFDLKHMTGYYNPEISGDGKKVVVEYMEQFLSWGSVIVEIDLKTKERKELIGYRYFKPKYSPDGQKIVMAKGHKITKKKTWVNTLYIFDIQTGKKTKIGKGIEYMWRTDHTIPQSP